MAKKKSNPPSPCTTIPKKTKCDKIAPNIKFKLRREPSHTKEGMSKNKTQNDSNTASPYLPQGSIPKVEKINLDSSEPENLKNKVCAMINVATNRAK